MNVIPTECGKTVIEFSCDHCGGRLTVPVAYAGIEGPCPKCGVRVASPQALPGLPDGVAEFIPLNRSNLRDDEAVCAGVAEEPKRRRRRSGVSASRTSKRDFVAKQRIEVAWGQDDSWKEPYRLGAQRSSRRKGMRRRFEWLLDSSWKQTASEVFAPAAIFIVVGTVIFMKLDGWGLKGEARSESVEVPAEAQGKVLAEVATAVGAGGGGKIEEASDELSNLAAFERVRASSEEE